MVLESSAVLIRIVCLEMQTRSLTRVIGFVAVLLALVEAVCGVGLV